MEKTAIDKTSFDKVKKVINFGYVYAAGSMAKFTKENVFSDIPFVYSNELKKEVVDASYVSSGEIIYILSTDLIGSVACKSYLFFKESEAIELAGIIQKNMGLESLPQDEIMKELDNILVAGVTTCLSNQMNCNVYGGVPILRKVDASDLYATIEEDVTSLDFDLDDFDYFLTSKTKFLFSGLGIKPEFLWVIPDEFVKEIK